MTNLQIVMIVPIQKKLPVNVRLRGAGPGAMEKESTQWKYIICLLLNIRTMNDFKRVFLYWLILKKVKSTGIKPK